jgi:hypothetical protein
LVYQIDDQIEKKLSNIIQPLFELFYHRHKIIKAFIESRNNYELAHKLSVGIETIIENLEATLEVKGNQYSQDLKEDIKQLMHDSLHYQRTLQTLENFDNTISIHLYNYQQKLEEISDRLQVALEELTSFNLFFEKTAPYFQRQIQGDLGYFKHGTDLINTAIASIRGIVEIEQAESDRSLERTIQILGAGLGAGGIAASAISGHVDKPLVIPQANSQIHPAVHSFLWSLLATILIGGLVGWINGTIPALLKTRKDRSQLPKK